MEFAFPLPVLDARHLAKAVRAEAGWLGSRVLVGLHASPERGEVLCTFTCADREALTLFLQRHRRTTYAAALASALHDARRPSL